jgi:hypothetical protein
MLSDTCSKQVEIENKTEKIQVVRVQAMLCRNWPVKEPEQVSDLTALRKAISPNGLFVVAYVKSRCVVAHAY